MLFLQPRPNLLIFHRNHYLCRPRSSSLLEDLDRDVLLPNAGFISQNNKKKNVWSTNWSQLPNDREHWPVLFSYCRLILFWEDSDRGRHFLQTASILLTRQRYIRDVKPYSCLESKQATSPAAVYFPKNHNHYLLWNEPTDGSWAIGGELLQGNQRFV